MYAVSGLSIFLTLIPPFSFTNFAFAFFGATGIMNVVFTPFFARPFVSP